MEIGDWCRGLEGLGRSYSALQGKAGVFERKRVRLPCPALLAQYELARPSYVPELGTNLHLSRSPLIAVLSPIPLLQETSIYGGGQCHPLCENNP